MGIRRSAHFREAEKVYGMPASAAKDFQVGVQPFDSACVFAFSCKTLVLRRNWMRALRNS